MFTMVDVIKRSGIKEPFDIEKLRRSILRAALDAKVPLKKLEPKINSIVKEVEEMAEKKGEIDSSEMRVELLSKLKSVDETIVDSWKRFDSKYKLCHL
jgi:transcriptional regulator NrdR family protein